MAGASRQGCSAAKGLRDASTAQETLDAAAEPPQLYHTAHAAQRTPAPQPALTASVVAQQGIAIGALGTSVRLVVNALHTAAGTHRKKAGKSGSSNTWCSRRQQFSRWSQQCVSSSCICRFTHAVILYVTVPGISRRCPHKSEWPPNCELVSQVADSNRLLCSRTIWSTSPSAAVMCCCCVRTTAHAAACCVCG